MYSFCKSEHSLCKNVVFEKNLPVSFTAVSYYCVSDFYITPLPLNYDIDHNLWITPKIFFSYVHHEKWHEDYHLDMETIGVL